MKKNIWQTGVCICPWKTCHSRKPATWTSFWKSCGPPRNTTMRNLSALTVLMRRRMQPAFCANGSFWISRAWWKSVKFLKTGKIMSWSMWEIWPRTALPPPCKICWLTSICHSATTLSPLTPVKYRKTGIFCSLCRQKCGIYPVWAKWTCPFGRRRFTFYMRKAGRLSGCSGLLSKALSPMN